MPWGGLVLCVQTQECLTLCYPIDYSPPSSSVHEIFQARILEWVAILFFRGSSWPRDQTCVPCISCTAGGFFTSWATGSSQEGLGCLSFIKPIFAWNDPLGSLIFLKRSLVFPILGIFKCPLPRLALPSLYSLYFMTFCTSSDYSIKDCYYSWQWEENFL